MWMQGLCTSPPGTEFDLPGPGTELWKSPQCLVVSDHSIFYTHQPVWIDSLYLRMLPRRWQSPWTAIDADGDAEVYATRVTFQSTPGVNFTALRTDYGGKIICDGASPMRG